MNADEITRWLGDMTDWLQEIIDGADADPHTLSGLEGLLAEIRERKVEVEMAPLRQAPA